MRKVFAIFNLLTLSCLFLTLFISIFHFLLHLANNFIWTSKSLEGTKTLSQQNDLWIDRHFDVATFRYYDISILRHFDIATFRYCDISILRHFDTATFRYLRMEIETVNREYKVLLNLCKTTTLGTQK